MTANRKILPKAPAVFIFPRIRLTLLIPICLFVFGILLIRSGQLIFSQDSAVWSERRHAIVSRERSLEAYRGALYSHDGTLLAGNALTYQIGFDSEKFLRQLQQRQATVDTNTKRREAEAARQFLKIASQLIGTKTDLYNYALSNPTNNYLPLQNALSPERYAKLTLHNASSEYQCFNIQKSSHRIYPNGSLAAHAIGISSVSGKGLEGSERWFDSRLQETPGIESIIWSREHNSPKKRIVQRTVERAPKDGEDISLSIDSRAQFIVQKALLNAYNKHQAKAVYAVLLDATNGAIRSLASVPDFNPNDSRTWSPESLSNKVLSAQIQPGSTLKPATILAGLEAHIISEATTVNANKIFKLGNFSITDPRHFGTLTPAGVLEKSSNIGVIKLGKQIGKEALWTLYKKLNWGRVNPIHNNNIAPDLSSLDHFDSWSLGDFIVRTYGYGISMDLLDLSRLYLAIANNGKIPHPHIWDKAKGNDVTTPAIQPQNAKLLRQWLQKATSPTGTAHKARVTGFTAAGKTGTIRRLNAEKNKYEYHALFAGLFPATQPKFIMIIAIEHDKEEEHYQGGDSAAPVFGTVMQQLARIYTL